MPHLELVARFGIALLIGMLIGLEREYARQKEEGKAFAGIRTFPLISCIFSIDRGKLACVRAASPPAHTPPPNY